MRQKNARLGVDIGGTFTDIVLEVNEEQYSVKLLTTYDAPERAIIDGFRQVCQKASMDPSNIQQVIHGTTLATNALIERKGAKTAFVTTQGFRDVIEMRSESRFEQYDLNLELPKPLIPRQKRYVLSERIAANGKVLIAPSDQEIETLITRLEKAGYESIAIGFLHSYVNSSHEKKFGAILRERMPDAFVSLSCEVSPQIREYERFNTAIANAYIQPLMKSYLDRLEKGLQSEGICGSIFLMHSGGGIISLESAARFPVRLVESGPAGGVIFAAHIAEANGIDKTLSFDMGGTTAKICLVKDSRPKTGRVFEVARAYRFKKGSGMPISIPVINMVEIGAGGGSLAQVDIMKQIRVGPESSGSEPGPVCYNRGGTLPTVTDADLILGRLEPDKFAGGKIKLNTAAAAEVMTHSIGKALKIDTETAAYGISEVVDENMANAARVHAVENGENLSDYTMIAFGGAAPLHAARLCDKLSIDRLLIPLGAGVGSAIGFLRASVSYESARSVYARLSDFDSAVARNIFAELESEANGFVRSCDKDSAIEMDYKAYMRYMGQGWEIPVALVVEQARNPDQSSLKEVFLREYKNLFGREVEGMEIEITSWAVKASTPCKPAELLPPFTTTEIQEEGETRLVFDATLGKSLEARVKERSSFSVGESMAGPILITEEETTVFVPINRRVVCLPDGCLEIIQKKRERV